MSEVVKIVMDKNDLQPLADEVKKLRGGNESITLAQMEDELLSVNDEVDVQAELLVQIAAALEGKAAGGGEQATPEISVNSSNGLITATAGAKSSTYQMAFQPAKTITPSTASQVAVSSGYYTGGNITVAGDSNLISNNIRSGVSIFGVNGTLEEGSMEGVKVEYSENEDAILSGTVSGIYVNDRVTSIKSNAFRGCETLTSVNFPVCSFIDWSAFFGCEALTSINFPVCERIGLDAFRGCWCLTSVDFPACKDIGASAFYYCLRLTSANFPACSSIGSSAFSYCGMLTSINFPMCERIGDGAFYDCSSLTSVNFPVCKSIGFQAFCNCSRLTYANFPMCYWIFDGAFSNCSNLASVSFPACGYIGEGAFSKCISLTSINSPSTSTISKNAF